MIANWLFEGIEPLRIVHALNRLVDADGLAFHATLEERNKVEATFEDIRHDIDRGLPVLLCHQSQSLGHHAVVVVGYQIEKQLSAHPIYWLSLCDPGGDNVRQWEQLTTLSSGRLELVRVEPQDRLPRPDRYTTSTNKDNTFELRWRERYWFHNGQWDWVDSEKLFEQVVPKAS